ncbi:hypothetical protein LSHI6S_02085 [Leifsonia shinshuensis]
MAESEFPMRSRSCPRCGSRATVDSNPYYGVGLAVHSHLWSCSRCDFVAFLRLQTPSGDDPPTEQYRPAHPGPRRGVLARLFRFFGR